jgi:hypothetical protein
MATSPTKAVEIDAELLERARLAAEVRGVDVPQLVSEALEHELGDERSQPAFSLIGAFSAERDDLGEAAGDHEYEPPPFR